MIVVSGADGFIGSHVVENLDDDIVAVDYYGGRKQRFFNEKISLTLEPYDLLEWIENNKPSHVVHLGACTDTRIDDWAHMMRMNFEYSVQLWAKCGDAGVPMIYASSAATYGEGEMGWDDNLSPNTLTPLNCYGKSKNFFDIWASSSSGSSPRAPSPPTCVGLKFFNVYGQNEIYKGPMASMISKGLLAARAHGKLRLFKSTKNGLADGEQKRDFVYVGDVVDVIQHFLKTPTTGIYNVGTGIARTFNDLARAVFDAIGIDGTIEYVDMPAEMPRTYQNHTCAKIDRLRKSGFSSQFVGLEDGSKLCAGHRLRGTGGAA
jgi:ADP-L-glycero-D-manno-heptose 6-epimerase